MMFQPLDSAPLNDLPQTVVEVVELLYSDLSLKDRAIMARLSEEQLDATVYLALAKIIRKEFGLYSQNDDLIASCRGYMGSVYDSYEDPAMIIVKELWKRIRNHYRLHLVKG